jgi:hypothetical protein
MINRKNLSYLSYDIIDIIDIFISPPYTKNKFYYIESIVGKKV